MKTKKVRYSRKMSIGRTEGFEVVEVETGKPIGVFTGSVGPYGTSCGCFTYCKTTAPFEELGLELVK